MLWPLPKAQPRDLSISDIVSQPWVPPGSIPPCSCWPGPAGSPPKLTDIWAKGRSFLGPDTPTLDKHHWELTFPETIPKHPPPGKPSSSQTCLLLAKLRFHRAVHPGKAAVKSPVAVELNHTLARKLFSFNQFIKPIFPQI